MAVLQYVGVSRNVQTFQFSEKMQEPSKEAKEVKDVFDLRTTVLKERICKSTAETGLGGRCSRCGPWTGAKCSKVEHTEIMDC